MGGWCVRDIIVMMCGAPTEPPAGFAMTASDLLVLAPRPAGSKSACNRLSVPEMVWIAVRAALRWKFRYVVPFSGTGRPVSRGGRCRRQSATFSLVSDNRVRATAGCHYFGTVCNLFRNRESGRNSLRRCPGGWPQRGRSGGVQ